MSHTEVWMAHHCSNMSLKFWDPTTQISLRIKYVHPNKNQTYQSLAHLKLHANYVLREQNFHVLSSYNAPLPIGTSLSLGR